MSQHLETIRNLPRLQSEHTLQGFNKPAEWLTFGSLDALAQAIWVNVGALDLTKLKSVPDPWGPVAGFRDALLAKNNKVHPAHSAAEDEWRGLLALIGLRAFRNNQYTLRVVPVELGDASGQAVTSAQRFLQILGEMKPAASLDGNLPWSPIYLLVTDFGTKNELVGILSPLTIVARAKGANPENLKRMLEADKFGDPLKTATLTPEELSALHQFVVNIRAAVWNLPETDGKNRLIELLDDYARDIQKSGADDALPAPVKDERTLGAAALPSVFGALDTVWRPGELGTAESDCLLKIDDAFRRVFGGAVLADSTVCKTLNKPAQRTTLWGKWRMSTTDDIDTIRRHAHGFGNRGDQGYLVIEPDDIFSPTYTPLEKQGVKISAQGQKWSEALLPLKPLALLLIPRTELLDRLSIWKEGAGWVVQLKLDLVDRRGTKYSHTIKRVYAPTYSDATPNVALEGELNGQVVRLSAPSSLAAWPDFSSDVWHWNFLFFDANPSAVVPTSGFSAAILLKDLEHLADCDARWRRLKEWANANGPWAQQCWNAVRDNANHVWFERIRISRYNKDHKIGTDQELQRCDHSFDAVSFMVKNTGFIGRNKGPETQFAGIGLLPAAPPSPQNAVIAHVATDLGTTNTIVCAQYGATREAIRFAPHLRLFNAIQKDNRSADSIGAYNRFLPLVEIVPPFATVLQGRRFTLDAGNLDNIAAQTNDPALWQDYIFFDNNADVTMSEMWDPGHGALHFNIKWSTDERDRLRIGRFLRQTGFMTLAELASRGIAPNNVNWYFSYPLAFSEADVQDFQTTTRKVVGELCGQGDNLPANAVQFCTESTAAAVWFKQNAEFQTMSQIVMDIGGGTTDIALRVNGQPIWSDSFRLAGQHLMVDFLVGNKEFLQKIKVVDSLLQTQAHRDLVLMKNDQVERFRESIGVIVNSRQFGESLSTQFANVSGTPEGKKLECGAYLLLSGLLYYVGLQVRALLARNDLSLLVPDHLDSLSVCFAGRGSGMLALLKERRPSPDSHFMRSLGLFAKGMNSVVPPRIEARTSTKPKHEVSHGMLYWQDVRNDIPRVRFSVLGEIVEGTAADGTPVRLAETAAEDELLKLREVDTPHVQEFQKFLNAMKSVGMEITLSPAAVSHLETQVTSEIKRVRDGINLGHDVPDPPFIVMLRETLAKLYLCGDGGDVRMRLLQ